MNTPPQGVPPNSQKAFKGEIFTIWQWEQELFDGTYKIFERAERADAAFILGVLPDQKLLLIQDEQPAREAVVTLPGGKIEHGENPKEAVRRELLEETGYEVTSVQPWFSYSLPGKVCATFHTFIGQGLTLKQAAQPEAGEKITLLPVAYEDFFEFILDTVDRFSPLRTVVLELMLDEVKKEEFKKLLYG